MHAMHVLKMRRSLHIVQGCTLCRCSTFQTRTVLSTEPVASRCPSQSQPRQYTCKQYSCRDHDRLSLHAIRLCARTNAYG